MEGSQRGDWWRADKEGTGGRQTKRGLVEGRQRGPMAVGRQLLSQYRTRPNKLSAIGQVTVTGRGLCHRQVCVRLFVCVYVCACVRAGGRACARALFHVIAGNGFVCVRSTTRVEEHWPDSSVVCEAQTKQGIITDSDHPLLGVWVRGTEI